MGTKIKEFRQYNNLFTELVRKGIKLKYRRSYLGIVWSMIEPLLISLVVLAVVALVLGVFPTWRTLLAIVPLINLFLLSIGAGMILATIGVYFRDMEYLWNVALMLIMYTCAIFYNPNKLDFEIQSAVLHYQQFP